MDKMLHGRPLPQHMVLRRHTRPGPGCRTDHLEGWPESCDVGTSYCHQCICKRINNKVSETSAPLELGYLELQSITKEFEL